MFLAAVLVLGIPGRSAVTITIPYSSTPVSDAYLDGDPGTGEWTDAASWSIPLENGASDPYGTATLHHGMDPTSLTTVDGTKFVSRFAVV